jgi:hypothetical protein
MNGTMGSLNSARLARHPKPVHWGEHCQCAFFGELFEGMIEEDLSPEEERARDLEFEVRHIQKKYGDEWMKYYPYHLDKDYDDEYGNPHDYGMGSNDEEEGDDWWRK